MPSEFCPTTRHIAETLLADQLREKIAALDRDRARFQRRRDRIAYHHAVSFRNFLAPTLHSLDVPFADRTARMHDAVDQAIAQWLAGPACEELVAGIVAPATASPTLQSSNAA